MRKSCGHCKAPEDWRTPKRFAYFRNHRVARSVLDCGGPPPLFPEACQTVPMLTGTAIPTPRRQISLCSLCSLRLRSNKLGVFALKSDPIMPAPACSKRFWIAEILSRKLKWNFCIGGVRPSRPQQSGVGGRLGNVPWLEGSRLPRPGTGALRHGLVRAATTG